MAGINKVILVGHLGKDPEVKKTNNDAKYARFTLATTENYKDKVSGEKKEITEWHNIICWRGLADVAEQWLKKGQQIYVEGKIRTRSWEDNGVKKFMTEIAADTFTMLSSGKGGENTTQVQQQVVNNINDLPPIEEDDLPF